MSRHLVTKALLGLTTAAVVLAPSSAFAKGGHLNSPPAASCAATSNPVAVNSTYTVVGSGLPANTMVQFLVTDSSGAESSTTAMTGSNGSASVSGHAWVAGTDSVTITDTTSKWSTLTSCSFQVS